MSKNRRIIYHKGIWRDKHTNELLWKDIERNVHAVSLMEDSHIINCINKIKRDNWRTEYLMFFEQEMLKRKTELGKILYV